MYISKIKLIITGVITAGAFALLGAGTAYAEQTHMDNALSELQQAQSELQQAIPDKGGHRVEALSLVDQAIIQVNQGIAVGPQ